MVVAGLAPMSVMVGGVLAGNTVTVTELVALPLLFEQTRVKIVVVAKFETISLPPEIFFEPIHPFEAVQDVGLFVVVQESVEVNGD